MQRTNYYSCPNGCGAILKIKDHNAGTYKCPSCGHETTLERLKPYKLIRKDKKAQDTTTQCFFTFKARKPGIIGGEIYLDKWEQNQADKQKVMSGKGRRRF